jgi:hypothetical protein
MPGTDKQVARKEEMPKLTKAQQEELDYFTAHKPELTNITDEIEAYRHIMVNIPGVQTTDLQRMDEWIVRLRSLLKD